MLTAIDLRKIFEAVRQKGYTSAEIYAESALESRLIANQRRIAVESFQSSGVSLRCFNRDSSLHLATTETTSDAILKLLDGSRGGAPRHSFPIAESTSLKEKSEQFASAVRKAESLTPVTGIYEDRLKKFQVAQMNSDRDPNIAEGTEAEAVCTFEWKKAKGQSHEETFAATELKGFWDGLDEKLQNKIRGTLPRSSAWPMPHGPLPVLWSPRSCAKLLLHFLKAFEGDYVIQKLSFVDRLTGSLPFDVKETFSSIDDEGSEVRNISFLEGDQKQIACDRWLANLLGARPTGHGRRASFEDTPTIALWAPEVIPQKKGGPLLPHLEKGIHIRDLKVLRSHPSSPIFLVELSDAVLLHHGAEGEAVEPTTFSLNCVELFQTFETFSEEIESICFPVRKNDQRFLTAVRTGAALSERFALPGTVPPSYYW